MLFDLFELYEVCFLKLKDIKVKVATHTLSGITLFGFSFTQLYKIEKIVYASIVKVVNSLYIALSC